MLSKIGNNAPNVTSYMVNAATNQMTSNGATYDANGNMTANGSPGQVTSFGYDEANRLSGVTPPGNPTNNSQATYAYDARNQRVYASISTTVNSIYTANYYIYFYGADGKKLGVWQLTTPDTTPTLTVVTTNLWFGGRLIQRNGVTTYEDRLQSAGKYFPYGEDRYNPTPANPSNDQEKFGTYTRDSISGLDYALNRYYGAGMGRFMSADPYISTAGPQDPQGWNRYAYTRGNPVGRTDRLGLLDENPDDGSDDGCTWDEDSNTLTCPEPYTPTSPDNGNASSGPTSITVSGMTFTNWGNTGPRENQILNALGYLSKRIDTKCENWLMKNTGNAYKSFQSAIDEITSNNLIGYANVTSAPGTLNNANTNSGVGGMSIIVNVNGAFFNSNTPVGTGIFSGRQIGAIKSDTLRADVFILLHEFGHLFNAPGFKNDNGNQEAGNQNNDDVWNNCKQTILGASNKGLTN